MACIGTVNVGTLPERVEAVLDLAEEQNLDAIAVQETKLAPDCVGAVKTAAAARGWKFIAGEPSWGGNGDVARITAGVGWFTRWPAAKAPPVEET